MDLGRLNLAMKLIGEEYKLTEREMDTFKTRMLADDQEFEKIWALYKNKSRSFKGGVDKFKDVLKDILG
jgi:hypothetical protein